MRIELRDEEGRRLGRIQVDPTERPTRVAIPDTDREAFLNWDTALDDSGGLRRCVHCECTDLYRAKTFPPMTGLVVVLAFAGAVVGVLGENTLPLAVYVGMIAILVLDVVNLILARQQLVCYRCRTTYRSLPIARYHRPWDGTVAERYIKAPFSPRPERRVRAPNRITTDPAAEPSTQTTGIPV